MFILSDEAIKRPEFDLYMKTTTEAIASIAESTKESAKESRESNQILREYIIHNNNKHDETKKQVTHQGVEITSLKEAVAANKKITSFWLTIWKYVKYIIIGGLTAYGVYLADGMVEKPDNKTVIESVE